MAAAPARRGGYDGRISARPRENGRLGSLGQAVSHEHGQIAQIQRARIVGGMFDVVCEHGAVNVTVAHVVARSGVSRRTFYEQFANREDCFLAAFEDTLALTAARVLPAYREQSKWNRKIRAGLTELLSFLDEEPKIGRLLICESLSAGVSAMERRGEVIATLIDAVDRGREESRHGWSLPALTAEGSVGAVLSILHAQIEDPQHEPLVRLVNPLMGMIVTPYLGFAASRRELEQLVETPVARKPDAGTLSDPFKGAGMRLTYRTVRVLMAIHEHPETSNRLIADTAEIRDQGQVSKLLGRLRRAGMVSNTGLGPGQGAPNAWTLTPSGHRVIDGIRSHIESPSHRGETDR
jgi:AcrR family transcriptional regulator